MEPQAKLAKAKQASRKKSTVRGTLTKDLGRPAKDVSVSARQAQASRTQPSKLAAGIMRTLHNEHTYISTLQDSLERQTKQLAPGGKPDYQIISDMLDYIANYPAEFHHPLEDLIYERLAKRHQASNGAVEELLSQHKNMAHDTEMLAKQVSAICAGKQKPRRNKLRRDLQDYVALHRAHIYLEESTVFPAAKKFLQESDWQAINSSLHVFEDPLFSDEITNKYKRLADFINNKSEEAIAEFALAEEFGLGAIIETAQASADGLVEIGGVCKRHVRNSVKQNIETIKASRQDESGSLVSLPGKLLNDSMKASRDTLREIARVLAETRTDMAEPFSARVSYFKDMRKNNKREEE